MEFAVQRNPNSGVSQKVQEEIAAVTSKIAVSISNLEPRDRPIIEPAEINSPALRFVKPKSVQAEEDKSQSTNVIAFLRIIDDELLTNVKRVIVNFAAPAEAASNNQLEVSGISILGTKPERFLAEGALNPEVELHILKKIEQGAGALETLGIAHLYQ